MHRDAACDKEVFRSLAAVSMHRKLLQFGLEGDTQYHDIRYHDTVLLQYTTVLYAYAVLLPVCTYHDINDTCTCTVVLYILNYCTYICIRSTVQYHDTAMYR